MSGYINIEHVLRTTSNYGRALIYVVICGTYLKSVQQNYLDGRNILHVTTDKIPKDNDFVTLLTKLYKIMFLGERHCNNLL